MKGGGKYLVAPKAPRYNSHEVVAIGPVTVWHYTNSRADNQQYAVQVVI